MGSWNIWAFTILVIATVIYHSAKKFLPEASIPELDENEYWGPGKREIREENNVIVPFEIGVKPELIKDLMVQLNNAKYQKPLENVAFEYGFNGDYLREVITYWRESYLTKWTEHEKYLNSFPQYLTQIQGLNMHFIHVKPKRITGKTVLPLLLLHGWPGSVREFYEIIPLLTNPNPKSPYVFEVVVPSLIGYGWSEPAYKPGFGLLQMAVVMRNLMLRLGHDQFYVQGGDWGSVIGARMAAIYPQHILGYHTNMFSNMFQPRSLLYMFFTRSFPELFLTRDKRAFYQSTKDWFLHIMEESGYFHIQATKPDTIGVALLNNPVGLAAYILEKFSTWTNPKYKHLPDGGLTQRFSFDALLDNIMIYYLTNSIATSQRFYAEAVSRKQASYNADIIPITVPTGIARFLHDLSHNTDYSLSNIYKNITHSAYYQDGGHFAALEKPQVLYNDFILFVQKARTPKSRK